MKTSSTISSNDTQFHIRATLAANAAPFLSNQAYRHILQKWQRLTMRPKVDPNGRIDIGSVARFLLGMGKEIDRSVSGKVGRMEGGGEEAGQSGAPRRKGQKGGPS
jgi:hypothetical protein